MKATGKIISVLFALLLFFTGCTSGELDDSSGSGPPSSSSGESTPDALPEAKKLTGGKLVEPIVIPGLTDGDGKDVTVIPFPVYDNKIIVNLDEQCKNEDGEYLDAGNYVRYSYNLDTQKTTYMGRIDYVHYGPNDLVVMKDQYLYQAVHAAGSLVFCGFSLNGEKEKIIEPGGEETANSSLWHLSKLNDEEIIIYGWDFLPNEDDVTEYYIKKYNVSTGAYDELIRTSCDRKAEQGKDILDVECVDGLIFAYTTFPDQQIEVYDGNGNYVKSYSAETINRAIRKLSPAGDDSLWKLDVYGDYFVVRANSSKTFIFRLSSGEALENVAVIEDYVPTRYLKNQKGEPEYLMLTGSEGFQIFDFKTETVRSFTFDLDEQCKYLEEVSADEEGNVMFCLSSSKDHGEDAVMKRFYFSADELREQLAD